MDELTLGNGTYPLWFQKVEILNHKAKGVTENVVSAKMQKRLIGNSTKSQRQILSTKLIFIIRIEDISVLLNMENIFQ